jgi:putative ABC transport system ATP-binding protein
VAAAAPLVQLCRSQEVLQMLRRFNRERGQTLLLVTHNPEVGETCDRIIHMRDGVVEGVEQRPS